MKPVMQDKLGPPDGNCMAACVASILELGIDEVPNPHGRDIWWEQWQLWLGTRGLQFANIMYEPNGWRPTGYWIGDPDSPRLFEDDGKPTAHAVVCVGNEIVHDPHPQSGLFLPCDLTTCKDIVIIYFGPLVIADGG